MVFVANGSASHFTDYYKDNQGGCREHCCHLDESGGTELVKREKEQNCVFVRSAASLTEGHRLNVTEFHTFYKILLLPRGALSCVLILGL